MSRPARYAASATEYVVSWVTVGALVTGSVLIFDRANFDGLALTALALVVVTALAEIVELNFQWSKDISAAITLIEAAIVANLLLLPPGLALLASVAGVVAAQLLRRRELLKLGFNAGQTAVAAGTAIAITHLTPDIGPLVNGLPILGAIVGMAAYGAINLVALAGLLQRIAGRDPEETIREHGTLTAASMIGNTAIGILVGALWITQPALLPLLLAPAAGMHLSYRGSVRTTALLAQVRSEHERLDRVVLGASDGIVLLDQHGTIELWNRAMEILTGVDTAGAVGRDVAEIIDVDPRHDGDAEGDASGWLLRTANPDEPTRVSQSVVTHPDGTRRDIREHHTHLFDQRGRCTGDVVIVHDITRQVELDAMKGDFVARVSHELRTPLTPIKGFTKLLLTRGDELPAATREQCLREISDRTDHLAGLVEDLLLVSQLDEGRAADRCTVSPIDVGAELARLIGWFRQEHPTRHFHLNTSAVGDALGDPARVTQIVTNLLSNAVTYSAPETSITIDVTRRDDHVCVSVIDHGEGIPAAKQQAIFDRFHRLEDPMRMRTGGAGLGLFIARELAHAMRGHIEVDSRPGHGSTFTLHLPVADAAPASTSGATSPVEVA